LDDVDVGSFPFGNFGFGACWIADESNQGILWVAGEVFEKRELLLILVSVLEEEVQMTDSNASRGSGDEIGWHVV
jgi:hypothetical protein